MLRISILFLFACRLNLLSATWYVDNGASASSNSGQNWANAWTGFTKIRWGTGGVLPGDTVVISGGDSEKVYYEPFTVGISGQPDAWITVKTSTEAGHGGKVIIDGSNSSAFEANSSAFGGFLSGASYCRVSGLPNTNIVVRNWVNPTDREKGIGFYAGSPTSQLIEGICISNANNGFYYNGANKIEIRNCSLIGIRGDYAFRYTGYFGPTATDFSRIEIHHNTVLLNADFLGGNGGPDGVGCGNGVTLHDNVFRCVNGPVTLGQHPDGIQALGGYVKVYNNYFANFLNAGIKFEPIAPTTEWRECYAYNNVVVVDDAGFAAGTTINGKGIEIGSAAKMANVVNVVICNNTFVDLMGLAINGGAGTWPVTSFVIENNIIYNCGRNGQLAAALGPNTITFNYNAIVAGTDGRTTVLMDPSGDGSAFKAFTQQNPVVDPISFARYSVRSQVNDYHLLKRAFALNLANYIAAADKDGVLRLSTGNWTAGAYEFNGPLAPRNFRFVQ
jgi:hypothetical protein